VNGDIAVVNRPQAGRRLALDDGIDLPDRHDIDVHVPLYAVPPNKNPVHEDVRRALVGRLSDYDRVVEVGIGRRDAVARALADSDVAVTATDVRQREVPPGVNFVVDDVTDPFREYYENAGAVYALNLPPELHRPAADLAEAVEADLFFTTLGGDPPTIPVSRETIPGETLYRRQPSEEATGPRRR